MTKTERDMLALLCASLWECGGVEIDDWDTVFNEMKEQAVAALPGEWLKTHEGPSSWTAFCAIKQGQWVRLMYGQAQLLKLLEDAGIPSVILKGAAAGMYYPHPSLRSMGDVDFLVKRKDLDRAAALLENSGYRLTHEKDLAGHHYVYLKDKISFELHWRLPLLENENEDLLRLFEEGIDKREWQETEGYCFPVLPILLNGQVLMFHINQHLREGVGLRQMIDWMMYVHHLTDEQWEALLPLFRSTGMERLALSVTAMCQKYLGLRPIVAMDGTLPVEALMSFVLEKGNFGRKSGFAGKTSSFILSATEKGGLFKRLQAGGLCRWKAARKHSFLRPFAWVYQAFRISGELIRNRTGIKEIMHQKEKAKRQKKMLDALGLKVDTRIVQNE